MHPAEKRMHLLKHALTAAGKLLSQVLRSEIIVLAGLCLDLLSVAIDDIVLLQQGALQEQEKEEPCVTHRRR